MHFRVWNREKHKIKMLKGCRKIKKEAQWEWKKISAFMLADRLQNPLPPFKTVQSEQVSETRAGVETRDNALTRQVKVHSSVCAENWWEVSHAGLQTVQCFYHPEHKPGHSLTILQSSTECWQDYHSHCSALTVTSRHFVTLYEIKLCGDTNRGYQMWVL